jgi:hypothetical protein
MSQSRTKGDDAVFGPKAFEKGAVVGREDRVFDARMLEIMLDATQKCPPEPWQY